MILEKVVVVLKCDWCGKEVNYFPGDTWKDVPHSDSKNWLKETFGSESVCDFCCVRCHDAFFRFYF